MKPARRINNEFYEDLGERWYSAGDDAIALLRSEAPLKVDWVAKRLKPRARVLDVGCGGGFLANPLAKRGFSVVGIDQSSESIMIAKQHDSTASVRYFCGSALDLPIGDHEFDAVLAMDLLEHVEDPLRVVSEAARVLRPGGKFFFHTFNRTPLARLLAIHAVRWFVPNTPRDLHVYHLFIRPEELAGMCAIHGLQLREFQGIGPRITLGAVRELLFRRRVPADFEFRLRKSLRLGYLGWAKKV